MAYKSRVSNKYMGASFAGNVNSANKSDATDLINILRRDVNPALEQAGNTYVANKKNDAKAELNKLLLTKSADQIEQEILKGLHPSLSGTFVDKTVSYHTGKFQAVEAIEQINLNKEEKYDHQTNNLPAFYKDYLPNFKEKDGSYALGFASVFNEYKANESIADAKVRSTFAYNKKIDEGVKIALNGTAGSFWETVNKGLDYKLPPELGSTVSGKMYNNKEKNDIALASAEYLLNTATGTDEIDRAINILTVDRGYGSDGQKLGSLLNTKREDVSEKLKLLRAKRVALENQSRYDKDENRKNEIRQIFIDSNAERNSKTAEAKGATPIMMRKNYSEQLELRKKLATYGDPTALAAFDTMVDNNRFVNTDPQVFTQITSDIFENKYTSTQDLMRDLISKNVSSSDYAQALRYFSTQEQNFEKGIKPIYKSDDTYSSGMTDIIRTIQGNFKVGIPGMEKPNSGEAIRNANAYMKAQIIKYEDDYLAENGKAPSLDEKAKWMMQLGNIMKTRFIPDDLQPSMEDVTVYEAEQKEIQAKQEAKDLAYKEAGVADVLTALNDRFELDTGMLNVPVADLSMFGDDTSLFSFDAKDKANFKADKIIPFMQTYLETALADAGVSFNSDVMKALEPKDFNNLIRNIAKQFTTGGQTIDPIDISNILKNIVKQQG